MECIHTILENYFKFFHRILVFGRNLLAIVMSKRKLTDEQIRARLFDDDHEESDIDTESDCDYVPSEDDNEPDEVPQMPSQESDSDEESVGLDDTIDCELALGTESEICSNSLLSKNGKETWQAEPPVKNSGKKRACNVVTEKSGPTRYALRNAGDIESCFDLFFRGPILEKICQWTNKEGTVQKGTNWKEVNTPELKKVLGVLLLIGVYKSKNEPIKSLWSSNHGRPVFNKAISRNRFEEILRFLRFDDADARRKHRSPDKLEPIRDIFSSWNETLGDAFTPGYNLTIDEQLVTFRGRCAFRQYIPSKPGKYRIQFGCCVIRNLVTC